MTTLAELKSVATTLNKNAAKHPMIVHPETIAFYEAQGYDMSGVIPSKSIGMPSPTATTEGVRKVLEGIGGA